ncbi:MAG: cell division protein CrgA [Acidimicrobiales bacterium]
MAKPKSRPSKTKTVGRYVPAESSGRVTQRRPTGADHSPRWYGWLLLALLIVGMLVITLNYLQVLPGSTSAWYLVAGLVAMFSAFYLATRYR